MRVSFTIALICAASSLATAASAQLSATNNLVTARTNQSLVGASVGTGTEQGQSAASVAPRGRPAVGVGVGSGKVDHFGSKGSVSVANNARLLGVDGAGGANSANSISVRNPSQRPALESATASAGSVAGNLPQ